MALMSPNDGGQGQADENVEMARTDAKSCVVLIVMCVIEPKRLDGVVRLQWMEENPSWDDAETMLKDSGGMFGAQGPMSGRRVCNPEILVWLVVERVSC